MKRTALILVLISILGVVGCSTALTTESAEPLLYLETPKKEGDMLKVDVFVKNAKNLAGVQMGFTHNPEYLSYDRAEEGTFLKNDGSRTFFFDIKQSTQPGLVKDVVVVRQGTGLNGDGYIATLYFKVLKSGTSRIDFEEVMTADEKGTKLSTTVQGVDATVY